MSVALTSPSTIVAIAISISLVSVFFLTRNILGQRPAVARVKQSLTESENKIAGMEAVFGAYPGVLMRWDQKRKIAYGKILPPRVQGSAATLAALQSALEIRQNGNFAGEIIRGLGKLDIATPVSDKSDTFNEALTKLLDEGENFSLSLLMPQGHKIDLEGRVAGIQALLWITDESVRGPNEKNALREIHALNVKEERDIVVFIEMMNKAPFPAWRTDVNGRINWVNPAYIRAVGGVSGETVMREQLQLDDKISAQIKDSFDQKKQIETTRHIVIEGRRAAAQIVTFPVPGGVTTFALDASEADTYREKLTNHVRAHDELLNNMDEGIVIFSSDQKMTFFNNAVAKIFDLPANFNPLDMSHGEWLDRLRDMGCLQQRSQYSDWKSNELSYYREWPNEIPPELWELPNGKILRLVRMRDARGSISLLFSDITDKMHLQSQYNTLINVQAATLDKLNEGIAVFGTDGRLKIFNSAFADLWNLDASMLEKEPVFDQIIESVMPLYHDKIFWKELKARATDPDPDIRRQVEGEIKRSNGTMIKWLSKPLPDGATLMAWDDVTQERKTEAALIERAAALEAADAIKSDFVSHVSYQLRTPLTTISGYADFLQNNGAGELSDKQSEYVFAIQSAAEDLNKIINDILDISAIEANVLDLELGDVDVYDLLLTSMDYVMTKAEDTKKTLSLNCPEDIGVVRADEKRLKQIVYNLLTNSLRFTKPGGHIELGANPAAGGGVDIWVKDNGVGIPSDRQPKVFETFQSSRGGAGLGLALVQRFVEVHGGWVDLVSEEGKGTHVTCYLPKEAPVSVGRPELKLIG